GDTNDLYEAPPLPPDGEFDVRFSSNRILETIGEKQAGKFPIVIQGAEFPVTLSWQENANSVKASIVIDGKETFLNGKATIRIVNPSSTILLKLLGTPAIPSAFALQQNYPNPFNPSTKFSFSVPKTSQVSIKIYDVLGREVVTLLNEKKDPGEYTLTWTAASIPSGVYFYRMSAGNFVQTKKMVLLK
ncbi:MAG TPA: T9SS type A sorting domain-containing protein, partial [Bacteroidota bacterium]|nr:T9SS type A sorting domain-containing protein [Bacteroidota bacterium]